MVDQLSFAVPKLPTKAEVQEPDPLKGGDVYKWALEQAELIRAKRYDEIDWVNVADEIESVGKSELRSLASNLAVVLAHMLKWDNQPEKRSRSWINSIKIHRVRIEQDLEDSGSMRAKLSDAIARGYRLGRATAAAETDLLLTTFPSSCPYDWEAIMTRAFVLEQPDRTP